MKRHDRYDTSYRGERVPTTPPDRHPTPRESSLRAAREFTRRKGHERLQRAKAEARVRKLIEEGDL